MFKVLAYMVIIYLLWEYIAKPVLSPTARRPEQPQDKESRSQSKSKSNPKVNVNQPPNPGKPTINEGEYIDYEEVD